MDIVYEIKGVFFLNTTRSHFEYVERERERERENSFVCVYIHTCIYFYDDTNIYIYSFLGSFQWTTDTNWLFSSSVTKLSEEIRQKATNKVF